MATIYLTEQGSKLSKTSKRLVIEKDGQTLLEIPEFKVERVLIFGNVQITTQAMAFLLDNGIEVSFLSLYGNTGAGFRLWNQRMPSSASTSTKNTSIINLRSPWQRPSSMQNSITGGNSSCGMPEITRRLISHRIRHRWKSVSQGSGTKRP